MNRRAFLSAAVAAPFAALPDVPAPVVARIAQFDLPGRIHLTYLTEHFNVARSLEHGIVRVWQNGELVVDRTRGIDRLKMKAAA